MNNLKKYIGLMLSAVAACSGFTACQDDVDAPGISVPVATLQANTTIADIKLKYWNSADNYIDTIKLADNGEHVVVSGRVVSSDASGNIYKSLVIQDATGALAMSINANSLYNEYRVGQEIVVDLTDMYIGKYSTLQQLGYPDYTPAYGWQATFMPLEFFKEHAQPNGLPEPAEIDTLTITMSQLGNGNEDLMKYQSQLVRLNNVYFVDGGQKAFCDGHKVNTNRTLKDENGNEIIVRTSGYANYWSMMLPAEHGDIVGILSTYKQSGTLKWQLLMRSPSDLLNFGDPTLPKGTETNPYDVLEAIDMVTNDNAVSGWYTGFIVGSLKAGVSKVTSPEDIIWGVDAEVDNTLVIGQTAESNTLDDCMLISLPQDSPLNKYGNLLDNPGNYLKQIWVLATPGERLGMKAFNGNTGTVGEFRIEGVTVPGATPEPGGDIPEGEGTEAKPYNPTQVIAMGANVNATDKWVSGYIVGFVPAAKIAEAQFSATDANPANVLIATSASETDYQKCVPVQLIAGSDVRAALNLKDNPGNLKKAVSVHGNLIKYFNVPGVKETDKYKIEGGGDTPVPPPVGEIVTSIDQNFEGGTSIPSGWTLAETSGNAKWFIRTYNNNNSAEITGYGNGKNPGTNGFESWLISPGLNVDGMSAKTLSFKSMVGYTGNGTIEVFALTSADPATANATKLTATVPSPTGNWSEWVESGNISLAQFSGTIYIGFRYSAATGSNYTTYRVDDVKAGVDGGGGEDPNPPTPPVSGDNIADLNTLEPNSSYGTYTTTAGWVATNCAILQGGDKDKNPMFSFIGSAETRAVCLNGKTSAPGSLVSPTLTGGIKTLTFKYGFAFSDTQCDFTVKIKQNGSVVQSKTVNVTSITKLQAYDFSWDVNVTGDFVMEIVNDCKSAVDKNKDRVSIWNISWTK